MRQVLWLLYKYEVLSDEHFAASKYAKKTGYGLSKSSKKLEVRLDQMGFKINVEGSWLTITVAVCLKCSCLTAVLCALCAFYQNLPEAAISRLQPRHTHTFVQHDTTDSRRPGYMDTYQRPTSFFRADNPWKGMA
jgi:hypothetical protein